MFKKRLPSKYISAHVQIFIATVIWAASSTVIRGTIPHIEPATFLFLRLLLVCILILPITIYQLSSNPIHKNDLSKIFLLGLLSQSSLILIFFAFKYTTVIDATIIGILGSVITISAGHYFYKDKISDLFKIGVAVASVGTLIVILEPILMGNGFNHENRLLGNFFALAYNLVNSLSIIWLKISLGKNTLNTKRLLHGIHLKPMKKTYPTHLITQLTFFVGLVTTIPLAFMENMNMFGIVKANILDLDNQGIFGVLYMAILSSIVAYILFQKSLETISTSESALYNYLNPIIAAPIAFIFLSEIPNKFVIVGSIIIASGVIIAEQSKSSKLALERRKKY